MAVTIYVGHVLDQLRRLPDQSVQCVVTSPPYYGLRDYQVEPQVWGGDEACPHVWQDATVHDSRHRDDSTAGPKQRSNGGAVDHRGSRPAGLCRSCGAWRGHLGMEPTLALFIEHLVLIFREVRRVLRDDGTLWLNMGSSYASRIIESDAYVMRDDLTDAERSYVYAELAKHFEAESKTLPGVWNTDAPAEQEVSAVLCAGDGTTSELRDEGV